ncbi:hypothetical protein [Arsukibacterium sp.]|uniref:hypothetical protein n=1 Tax=Arsukibacterium sp. TaxID=1977258 RepID=UPI003567B53C
MRALGNHYTEDYVIKTIKDGAFSLLSDTAQALSEFNDLEYMVIGGWCPVLRNTSGITHPGTLDVDILFKDSYRSGNLEAVLKKFIDAGFMPSAKHPFQLLKPQDIGGKKFVYNIDILHPGMLDNKDQVGMFVDHLDLDVPLNEGEKLKKVVSIVLPNSAILFKENLYDIYDEDGLSFNLVSFDGMFITKMDSCQKQKRERDSFDIYLAFLSNGVNVSRINEIAQNDSRIDKSLKSFKQFLNNKSDIFNANVLLFNTSTKGSPANDILGKLNA